MEATKTSRIKTLRANRTLRTGNVTADPYAAVFLRKQKGREDLKRDLPDYVLTFSREDYDKDRKTIIVEMSEHSNVKLGSTLLVESPSGSRQLFYFDSHVRHPRDAEIMSWMYIHKTSNTFLIILND